jgi:uncharacterized protein
MAEVFPGGYSVIDVEEGRLGKKVISLAHIPAGTAVVRFSGKMMDFEETRERKNTESFALQVGPRKYVYLDPPYCYFNHSCEPNCGVTPDLYLVTLRPVEEEEELTYDYSTTMLEKSWTMPCKCGKPSCRGLVADFDTLPAELRGYYQSKGVVQEFILKQLQNHGD